MGSVISLPPERAVDLVKRLEPVLTAGTGPVDAWTALVPAAECRAVIDAVEASMAALCSEDDGRDAVRRLMALGGLSSAIPKGREEAVKQRSADLRELVMGAPRGCVAEAVAALVQTLKWPPVVAELHAAIEEATARRRFIAYRALLHLSEHKRRAEEHEMKERLARERACPGAMACVQAVVDRMLGRK